MRVATLVFIILVGVVGITFFTKSNSGTSKPLSLAAGTKIYDVRTPAEYMAGHAKVAQLLPLADLQNGKLPNTAKDAPIAVYCHSGNRSGQATAILKQAGFTNITDIGAYTNLQKYGLETTS